MTNLADFFEGISAKRLSAVETQPLVSRQHEFNGTVAMKGFLGLNRCCYSAQFIYIGGDENDSVSLESNVTWYDARERNPDRSEYRLYFCDNEVMDRASEDDIVIIALDKNGKILLLILSSESENVEEVLWLFGIKGVLGTKFETVDIEVENINSCSLFVYLTEQIGIELSFPEDDEWIDLLLEKFGVRFPTTRELSCLAKDTLGNDVSPVDAPDESLILMMDREEVLFRQLERYIVGLHLEKHAASWTEDVDAFVKFSLSVQNRRKSRAGHALENHLEWIFQKNNLKFNRGVVTESRSKPDFLFPGRAQYIDGGFPETGLTMLGVKTTCKDRWRQVLNEAKRIPEKHLLTLQPAISNHQTNEMREAGLTLVLPRAIHKSYSEKQRTEIIDIETFIDNVSEKWNRHPLYLATT